jgi:signal transduction histidine kinase/CHASE3 domain sensor protein
MSLESARSRFATWLYQSSLGMKLNTLVFLIFFPSFGFTIVFVFITTNLQQNAFRTTQYREVLFALTDLNISLLNIETGIRGFILTNNQRFLEPYQKGLIDSQKALDSLESSLVFKTQTQVLREQILTYQEWAKNQVHSQVFVDKKKQELIWLEEKTRFDTLRKTFAQLKNITSELFEDNRVKTLIGIDFLRWFPWLLFVLLILGNLLWRWGVQKFVLHPLKTIASTFHNQVLDAGLAPNVSGNQDEILRLSNSLDTSYAALRIRTHDLELSNINLEAGRKQLEMNSELAVSTARMVAWDWKIQTDTVTLSSNTESILGSKALTWTTSQPCIAAIHEEDITAHLEIIAQTIQTGESYRSAYRIWNDTKQAYIWMEEFGTVRLDHDHQIIALNGVTQDITERKNIDLALRRINEAQKRFVGDAAHELRAPLTSIQGNLELLRRYPDMSDQDRLETIADAYHETARLGRLVADLLALARGDAGEGLRLEPMQLQEVLTDTIRQAKHLAANHQLEYSEFKPCTVEGDHDRLKQLLLILLENAIKYTSKKGSIYCSLECDQDWAEIRIKDTGMGIAPEDIPFVFERFFRADKARTRGTNPGGTGLGLPIAQWIVAQHGGEIRLESQVGIGTTAILRLPIAP